MTTSKFLKRLIFTLSLSGSVLAYGQGFTCGDTLTDSRDFQKYATVLVGSDCWFQNNLNYGYYVASDTLGVIHSQQTNNSIPEKYAQNNDIANFAIYGGLYEQAELMNYSPGAQGLCPDGWHVSTDQEWQDAISLAGGTLVSTTAGNGSNGLKALGTGMGSGTGTNTTGLALLPGGDRDGFGIFYGLGLRYIYWTSTSAGQGNAYHYMFWSTNDTIERFSLGVNSTGFSCRCVKDQAMGIEDGLGDAKSTLFPNPTNGSFNVIITTGQIGSAYSVHDMTGKVIQQGVLQSEHNRIDISRFPNGIYLFQLDGIPGQNHRLVKL